MTRFNPSDSAPGSDGDGRAPARVVPPNDYLLAMVGLYRKTAANGRDYLNCRYRVIHGEHEGAEFYSSLGIDVSNHNIAGRLGVYCRCIGQEEEFDLDNKGDLMRVFLGKPFKAKVKRREREYQGKTYTDNDVERYIPEVTDAERSVMNLFAANFRDTEATGSWGQTGGGTRDADPQGDPFAGGDQRGAGGSDPFDRNPPAGNPADDDIPFATCDARDGFRARATRWAQW